MTRNLRTGILGTATVLVALLVFGTALWATLDGFGPGPAALAVLALLALPFVFAGLTMVQRPGLATLGQAGAIVFAAGCLVAAFVCLYALVAGTFSLASLREHLDGLVWAAEAFLVPGIVVFGVATYVHRMLPRWSSAFLVLGSLLAVAALGAPDALQLLDAAIATVGLAGLGLALIPTPHRRPRPARRGPPVAAGHRGREADVHRTGPLVPGA